MFYLYSNKHVWWFKWLYFTFWTSFVYMCVCVSVHTHIHTYSYLYISFYIYLITWILICDHWFHAVFSRQSSGRKRKILEKSKKSKRYSQKTLLSIYYYSTSLNRSRAHLIKQNGWLPIWLQGEMVDPYFIHCHIFKQKFLFVTLKRLQTTLWIMVELLFLIDCEQTRHPLWTQLSLWQHTVKSSNSSISNNSI